MTAPEIADFLHRQRTAIIATTRDTGSPVMHAVWFVYLDNAIYINIQRDSFKFRNILRDPRVCALVEDGESYFELRGVSVEGEAAEVTDDAEALRVQEAQQQKDHDIGSGTEALPGHFASSRDARLKRGARVLVKIPLTRVRSWDFGKTRSYYEERGTS